QVANTHHDATHGHQGGGRETEFFSAKQRRDNDVPAGFQLAVSLHNDAGAQVIENESLMRLGQAELPGDAGVLNASLRRCAGASVMAADEDDVGMRLGDSRGNSADPNLSH